MSPLHFFFLPVWTLDIVSPSYGSCVKFNVRPLRRGELGGNTSCSDKCLQRLFRDWLFTWMKLNKHLNAGNIKNVALKKVGKQNVRAESYISWVFIRALQWVLCHFLCAQQEVASSTSPLYAAALWLLAALYCAAKSTLVTLAYLSCELHLNFKHSACYVTVVCRGRCARTSTVWIWKRITEGLGPPHDSYMMTMIVSLSRIPATMLVRWRTCSTCFSGINKAL